MLEYESKLGNWTITFCGFFLFQNVKSFQVFKVEKIHMKPQPNQKFQLKSWGKNLIEITLQGKHKASFAL